MDFNERLTALLDRLGVASGPVANRKWLAQAIRNRHAVTDDQRLALINSAVKRAREVKGGDAVNYASDVIDHVLGWRPRTEAEPAP